MLVEGLANSKSEELRKMAFNATQTWISSAYKGFVDHGVMYEKVWILSMYMYVA